jgi:hypothetical protein
MAQEQHYRPKELATLWGLSAKTILRLIHDEPGIIRLRTYSIPDSVATRIHQRLTQQPLQPVLSFRNPGRIKLFGDRKRGKSEPRP